MKLKAQRFVAGKLILKQALPAFAPVWLRLRERTELQARGLVSGKILPRP